MHSISLRGASIRLADVLPDSRPDKPGATHFSSCCWQAEKCNPGDVFVALTTAEGDGHEDAWLAVERGASMIVAERLVPASVPVYVVDDSREAHGRLCQVLAGKPAEKMQVIGVTGSHGKTVTTMLIASMLEAAGQAVGVMSSIGHSDSFDQEPARNATPTSPETARWMSRMASAGCSHAVLEVSSRGLAERRFTGIEFDAAVLTNLRREHVQRHGSLENYRNAKRRVFSHLKSSGFAVFNGDDHGSREMLHTLDVPALTFGLYGEAELSATVVERHPSEQTFLLQAGSDTIPVRTAMIGDHHVANCLAAAAVGLTLGIDLPTIVRGLEKVDRVPGRMERIECGQPFSVFVDAARSPETLAHSLKTLRQVTTGRVICVFGCPGERNRSVRPRMGRVVERCATTAVITSDNPRHEEPLEIAHDILDGYERPHKARVLPTRAEAIRWALNEARPGDAVLIAGKGDRTYQIVGGKRIEHDDREVARRCLYQQASKPAARPTLRIFG
jgi:UDP-N-acetylmuramoyl-L-alanyl-D-glutamate--2,6-diaminopimelate ligase